MSDYKAIVSTGLTIAASADEEKQLLGWGAVSYGVQRISSIQDDSVYTLKRTVETQAAAAGTFPAVKALIQMYKSDVRLRNERLFSTPIGMFLSEEIKLQYRTAVLAESTMSRLASDELSETTSGAGSNPFQLMRFLIVEQWDTSFWDLFYGQYWNPALREVQRQSFQDRLEAHLNGSSPDDLIVSMLITSPKSEYLRQFIWGDQPLHLRFLDGLVGRIENALSAPLERAVAATAFEVATALTTAAADDLSLHTQLSGIELTPITTPNPMADRTVSVSLASFVLSADYHPFPNCAGCDWGGDIIWHSAINSGQVIPISQAGQWISFLPPAISNPSWRCLQNSDYYVGCTFGELQRTGYSDIGTEGVSGYGFGVEHRIWMPVLDANNGAVSWGSGRPRFNIRFGFRVSPDCNFVAVRWQGRTNSVSPIRCTSGCFSTQPIAIEPGTGWGVFCVVPGASLEFAVDYEAEIQGQSTRTGYTLGYNAASVKQDYIELVDINLNNANQFHYVDITAQEDPSILNFPSRNINGLLTYVASVTKALQDPNWPFPMGADVAKTAAGALVKLAILAKTSVLDLSSIAASTTQAPWKERQTFLKAALPLIAYNLFTKYSHSLELQTALLNSPLVRVLSARQKVTDALQAFADLTVDLGNDALNTGLRALSVSSTVLTDLDQLSAALFGVQEELSQLQHDLMTQKEFSCAVLRNLQFDGFPRSNPVLLIMKSDPAALGSCED